jgi:Tfp pilus assembly protein PilP
VVVEEGGQEAEGEAAPYQNPQNMLAAEGEEEPLVEAAAVAALPAAEEVVVHCNNYNNIADSNTTSRIAHILEPYNIEDMALMGTKNRDCSLDRLNQN